MYGGNSANPGLVQPIDETAVRGFLSLLWQQLDPKVAHRGTAERDECGETGAAYAYGMQSNMFETRIEREKAYVELSRPTNYRRTRPFSCCKKARHATNTVIDIVPAQLPDRFMEADGLSRCFRPED